MGSVFSDIKILMTLHRDMYAVLSILHMDFGTWARKYREILKVIIAYFFQDSFGTFIND